MILIAGPAADSDCADNFPIFLQRNTARENHDTPIVGGVDSEKLIARLAVRREIFCRDIERPRRICLLLGNIDTANPRTVHAYVRNEISAFVGHRNIHRLADFSRLLFGSRYDSSCIVECQNTLPDEIAKSSTSYPNNFFHAVAFKIDARADRVPILRG